MMYQTYKIVKLNGSDALVDSRDDLLSDGSGINMLSIKAIAETRDTSSDLVKLNTLLASI